MEHNVVAEIEIEDTQIEYYTSVILRQKFNEHHEFIIRINHDVLEAHTSFSVAKAQKLIGKSTIIRLKKIAEADEVTYEFRGIICEISLEQSEGFTGDLILKGYSPTILLENGANLASFYKLDLKKIVGKVTESLSENNFIVNVNNQYKKEIKYICQYKESSFHFLNRLSSDFSEWFYYDGTDINFGKPSSSKNIDITYGEDVNSIQLTLRLMPMTFSNYSYNSKDDKVLNFDAPAQVDGLDEYASYVLKESNKVFTAPVNLPLRQRVESKSDLQDFVKKQKSALAAGLEVLTGSSNNPSICIGAVANISVSRWEDYEYKKEEHGKFLITGIEHHISENGKYYNTFEAIPAGQEVIPVKNIVMPLAEPQIATVKDNKDPDNMGRVRVQMLWQKDNEMTDWLRVMTPDAGGGKDGAKNRGLVVVPEPGDQVLICFRYNDPDRPFIMGSMFHGKTGGGGGSGNNTKSLNSKSGHTLSLDDGKGITIVDKTGGNKIEIDGTNMVTVTSSLKIILNNGTSSLTMDADKITLTNGPSSLSIVGDKITLKAAHVDIDASSDAKMHSGPASFSAASGGDAKIDSTSVAITGSAEAKINAAQITVNASGELDLKGAMIKKNS